MVECTFCDGHALAELWVEDEHVGERICLHLCDECLSAYDRERDKWVGEGDA